MTAERVQGRAWKDEWATCACDLDLGRDGPERYVCAVCGGDGKEPIEVVYDDAAYERARRTGRWHKRCGHCNGAGWHP